MAPRPSLSRLRRRADPDAWAGDELVSLAEAAALFFPDGPFNAASLRAAVRRGELGAVDVCGRTFTTPDAVRRMASPVAEPRRRVPAPPRIPAAAADSVAALGEGIAAARTRLISARGRPASRRSRSPAGC